MKTRIGRRMAERQAKNAALCKLPLIEYLALPRRERKRRIKLGLDDMQAGRAYRRDCKGLSCDLSPECPSYRTCLR